MRSISLLLAFVALSCASTNRPAPVPVSQTRTTGAPISNPSYGTSSMDAWGDPAASGYSTHGSATPGATAPARGLGDAGT